MDYPSKYKNILLEIGLIKDGVVELRGYTSQTKNMMLDASNTWREGSSPEIDTTDLPIFINPVKQNGVILGDWRIGLTNDSIKSLEEDCRLPKFDNDEWPRIFRHGHKFDLSNPIDCSIFKIAVHNTHIAKSIHDFDGDKQAYWYNISDELEFIRASKKIKAEAFSYIAILSEKDKRDIMQVLFYDEGIRDPGYSLKELEIQFMQYAESHAEKVVKIRNMNDLKYRVLLIKAIEVGGVVEEYKGGQISYADGKRVAENFESCVKNMAVDKNLVKQIVEISESQRSLFVHSSVSDELDYIKQLNNNETPVFDTTIDSVDDIKLWGQGALRQYLAEHNSEGYEMMTIEQMRKEVLRIHNAKFEHA